MYVIQKVTKFVLDIIPNKGKTAIYHRSRLIDEWEVKNKNRLKKENI